MIGVADLAQAAVYINRAQGTNIAATDLEAIKKQLASKKIRRQVVQELKAMAKKAGLNGYVVVFELKLGIPRAGPWADCL